MATKVDPVVRTIQTLPTVLREEIVDLTEGRRVARLTCTCDNYQKAAQPLCAHTLRAINEGCDGMSAGLKYQLPPVVEVPLCMRPWLAPVVVLTEGVLPDSQAVVLAAPMQDRGSDEHIGFIFVGQGRRDLRVLILDWLIEKSVSLPSCTAAWHYAPLPWERTGSFNPNSSFHLANLADLLVEGQCRVCIEDNGVPDA